MEFDKVETIFDIDKNLLEKIDEFKNERILKHTNDEGKYNIIFHSIPLDAFSKFPMALEEFRIEFGKHPLFLNIILFLASDHHSNHLPI